MYCINCGTKIEDKEKICNSCKAKIEKAETDCWDEVLEEIEQELYAIPKDEIIRSVVSVVCLFADYFYLVDFFFIGERWNE